MYYGLVKQSHAIDMAKSVCDVFGPGKYGTAADYLIEIAIQETRLGLYLDPTPNGAGRGLTQIDQIAFDDIQRRAKKLNKSSIHHHWGIDLHRVKHDELDYNPLLALIYCRLFWLLIPEPIPATLQGRAEYWKKYYNTSAGKGTTQDYINNVRDFFATQTLHR